MKREASRGGGVIENIGPIERVTFPCPEGGGLVVFRGRNGSGKTTALAAVEAAVTGKGKVPLSDEAAEVNDRGIVEAHGVTLTIGKSTRRKGEADVTSLEGRLSVADLVDPGIADPDAADLRRIKALVGLSGAQAEPARFAEIVGGRDELEKFVSPDALKQGDLVSLAGAVKRGLESAARSVEQRAEHERNRAAAERAQAERSGPPNADAPTVEQAQASAEDAAAALTAIKAEQRRRHDLLAAALTARSRLDGVTSGPTMAEALDARLGCAEELERAEVGVAAARDALRAAEARLSAAEAALGTAQVRVEEVRSREQAREALRSAVAAADGLTPIGPEEIGEAEAALAAARVQVAVAIEAAKSREWLARSAEAEARAREAEREAERLREAAESTNDVLTAAVATLGVPLRVKRGRLVTDTDRRGETLFAELSHGERWRLAIEVAIRVLGQDGCLTIPQEAWEGLDPTNRAEIVGLLVGSGVVAYTAEATDDADLTVEVVG